MTTTKERLLIAARLAVANGGSDKSLQHLCECAHHYSASEPYVSVAAAAPVIVMSRGIIVSQPFAMQGKTSIGDLLHG